MIEKLSPSIRTRLSLYEAYKSGAISAPKDMVEHMRETQEDYWSYLVVFDDMSKIVWWNPLEPNDMMDGPFPEKIRKAFVWMYQMGQIHMKRKIRRWLEEKLRE